MTTDRAARMDAFLEAAGWGTANRAPLSGDASNRRYLRLDRAGSPAVLMDAPPDLGEDIRPFTAMSDWLLGLGLSAPRTLAEDPDQGFLLLEDLGDALYADHLRAMAQDEEPLYAAAVALLADLARPGPARHLAPYDHAVLAREAALFPDWWLGPTLGSQGRAEFMALVASATERVATSRAVTVLRDYHAENLLWLPGREGHARVGLLDYQDALAGHPAYDLVSLLEDARRDTSAALREAMISRYLAARPELDPATFRADYCALGAQRNLKIIGIFARLARRDGKPRYLSLIPRVWAHLRSDLSHPALGDLGAWVERNAPAPTEDALRAFAEEAAA